MKIVIASNGKKKIKISKGEWYNIGKKAAWIKESANVTIWDLLDDWGEEGYGIALISPDNKVVSPYIDASDYPDMILNKSANGAKVISGKYKDYRIIFHSGQLEDRIGEEYFPKNIGDIEGGNSVN